MSSLDAIDRKIRKLTGEEATCRPFMCDGSPIGCQVVQAGINPGTKTPFWPYWSAATGCDKAGWLAEHLRLLGKMTPTRDRIEVLCKALQPLRCLEMNMSHHYSKDQSGLSPDQRADTVVFDYLLETIRPKVLIVHGNLPIRHLERILKVRIKKDEFVSHKLNEFTFDIIAAKAHFSRVSREYLRDFGTRVKTHVDARAIDD